MSVSFGVSPIGWSNDDLPELGGDIPLETCLQQASAMGYSGIELGSKFPRKHDALKEVLKRFDLKLVSGWFGGSLLTLDVEQEYSRMREHAELLSSMGCSVLVYAETSNAVHGDRSVCIDAKPELGDDAWPSYGDKLNELGERLAAHGLRLAYHHHIGTIVQTDYEIRRLLNVTADHIGLVLDTGHAYAGRVNASLILEFPHRIFHVHCKDVRPSVLENVRRKQHSFLDGVVMGMFTVPGDGALDFTGIFEALAAIGYNGWLVVEAEQDPSKADPWTFGQKGLNTVKTLAARVHLL